MEEIKIKNKSATKWEEWNLPNEDEMYQLAQISMKYVRFLNPAIVEKIVKDNEKHFDEWKNKLTEKNINPDYYLWEGGSCCFPAVRRYAGSTEIAEYRKRKEVSNIPDAIKLDDNDFPKQIWSFIIRGTYFNKFGPDNYSLAHLIDHKKDKNRMAEEFEIENGKLSVLFGLYTCPTNTVFIPNSLLKPTDFNLKIRKLLSQKSEELYKDTCNILPSYIKVPKTDDDDKWNIKNFVWANSVGATENIQLFLDFRNKKMNELLKIQ